MNGVPASWDGLGLDPRLVRGATKLGHDAPTEVQVSGEREGVQLRPAAGPASRLKALAPLCACCQRQPHAHTLHTLGVSAWEGGRHNRVGGRPKKKQAATCEKFGRGSVGCGWGSRSCDPRADTHTSSARQLGEADSEPGRALKKQRFPTNPPPLPHPQALTIPAALAGRDIVARARTGTGKTLAYLLPALHACGRAAGRAAASPWRALILVPTRELVEQVCDAGEAAAAAAGVHARFSGLAPAAGAGGGVSASQRECAPARCGQVVVATPGRVASVSRRSDVCVCVCVWCVEHATVEENGMFFFLTPSFQQALRDGRLKPATLAPAPPHTPGLAFFIIDEADLLLSLPGYSADVATVAAALPRGTATLLLSATASPAVDELASSLLQNPLVVDATGGTSGCGGGNGAAGDGAASTLRHYSLHPSPDDRYATLLAALKFNAVRTRVLIFVATDAEGVKLRLLFGAFGIRTARVGAGMPLNARHHALQEFNRGVYDYLIATDGGGVASEPPRTPARGSDRRARGAPTSRRATAPDPEFGVVRGVDFKGVATVINFDAPESGEQYVHRAGRTGRAGAAGDVITFFNAGTGLTQAALEAGLAARAGGGEDAAHTPITLHPCPRLPPRAASALRYRCDDVVRSLTRGAVKEAAAQEVRRELLNSARLSAHFAARPADLALLRHDAPLTAAGKAAAAGGGGPGGEGGHLKAVPGYLAAAAGVAPVPTPFARRGPAAAGSRKRKATAPDPLKGGAFARTPRKGGDGDDAATELEVRAAALGKRDAKKLAKVAGPAVTLKRNVRKGKHRRR